MKAIYTIVGMKFRNAEAFVKSLPAGEPLKLIRELDNPHDHFAIQVWARDKFVAYVKGVEAKELAKWMDEKAKDAHADAQSVDTDMSLTAEDRKLNPPTAIGKLVVTGHWPQVEIEQ